MKPLVFVIGDSISIHYGPHLERMLRPHFAYSRKTGVEAPCVAAGLLTPPGGGNAANGGDSSAVLAYVRCMASEPSWRPDVLLLNCGLHDIKTDAGGGKQVPLEQYKANLIQIAGVVRPLVGRLVWVRTTPVDQQRHNSIGRTFRRFSADVESYNAAADEIMSEAAAAAVDLHSFMGALGPNVYCDHVHFVDHVRQLQAAYIAGRLAGLHAP
jgi:hypothetical protein